LSQWMEYKVPFNLFDGCILDTWPNADLIKSGDGRWEWWYAGLRIARYVGSLRRGTGVFSDDVVGMDNFPKIVAKQGRVLRLLLFHDNRDYHGIKDYHGNSRKNTRLILQI